MENGKLRVVDSEHELDLLPREETLIRLIELTQRYAALHNVLGAALTVAGRHMQEFGHPLDYGCCRRARERGDAHELAGDELDAGAA